MPEHSSTHPQAQPWHERWYAPGAIVFLGGIVLLIVEAGVDLPFVGSVSVLLTLAFTSLGWALAQQRRKLEQRLQAESRSIRKFLQSDLAKIGSELDSPYLQYLRDQLIERARRPLLQLVDEGRGLVTVEQCTEELIEAIRTISEDRHTEILAICGQKAWAHPDVQAYYEANYERAKDGKVQVKRIFIQEPGRPFSAGERAILQDHLERPNVEARVIFTEDVGRLKTYCFPAGFGFAILGDSVVVHWGFDEGGSEAGRRFRDPWFTRFHQQIFWNLWNHVASGDEAKIRQLLS